MRWPRRNAPSASVRTPVIVPPPPAVLFSEYMKKKPRRPSPVEGTVLSMLHAANPSGGVNETVRTRLVMVLETHQQPQAAGDPRFPSMTLQMVSIAIKRLVFAQGNMRLGGPAPTSNALFRHFAGLIMNEEVSVVLDAVGAYAEAHARVPGVPWMKDAEEAFLADVEDVLASTEYGVRGRELVLRTDLASAVLVDEPLRLLSAGVPALEKIDLKYREAVAELSAGKPADAITDAGTALEMLLDALGYSGGSLGDQLKAAKKQGWLAGVDTPLANALEDLVKWIVSVRNQRSDAHDTQSPDQGDAELMVRLVGVLVLRFGPDVPEK